MRPWKLYRTYDGHLVLNMESHYKALKLAKCNIFGLPLTQWDRVFKQTRSESSHFTRHISHITYCMWVCKFYKIGKVILEVIFKTSKKWSRMSLQNVCFMKILVLTKPTQWSSPRLVKNTTFKKNIDIVFKFLNSEKKISSFLSKEIKFLKSTKIKDIYFKVFQN